MKGTYTVETKNSLRHGPQSNIEKSHLFAEKMAKKKTANKTLHAA